jgi:hypothetical protein
MKILYVAHERGAVVRAARALHPAAPQAALTWSKTFESAIPWLQANPDTDAVIIDADVQGQSCAAFMEEVRSRGVATAVMVVTSASQLETVLAKLAAGADERTVDEPRRTGPRSDSELAAVAERLADLQVRHSASLAREARVCTALQQRLFELEDALRHADEQRASEAVAFADQLAARHAEFTESLTLAGRSRDALAAKLSETTAALDEAHQARRTDALSAAGELRRREADFAAALAEAVAARITLERALSEAEAAYRDAQERAAADLAAANERQASLEDLLAQEEDRRAVLDQRLAAAAAAQQESDDGHTAELTMAAVRLAELQARHDAAEEEHAAARAELEETIRAREHEIEQVQDERDDLRLLLERTRTQLDRLHTSVDEERQAYEQARLTSESEVQRLSAEHGQRRQAFDHLQAAFQTLERVSGDLSAERARLEAVVADRDSQLNAQAERHRIAEEAAQGTITGLEEQRRREQDASASAIARLQGEIDARGREVDALRARADALRADAERMPDLQARLDSSRREARRLFERARYGVCRCTPEGVITDANHAFVALLGRRRVEELRNMEFTAAAFDCAGDLGWVLERARTMRKTETVETNWTTGEGRPLIVRLQALSTATGSVEIIVEDITDIRALEARLRQAQRMEAVGRLASEVAVTCDALLRDVTRDAHEWLTAVAADDPRRRQVERLLTEVGRAAGFLGQLGAYGATQARSLEPVNVQRVLRDLAPVLKQVVGDRIELVVPKASGSFDVDADAERVERILVNVAAYARERMPEGGQVRIDVATTTVGRRIVAKYPSVRPGPHVLITVTELPRAGEPRVETGPGTASSEKLGVDLGALVEVIGTCGGHLWLEAQPAGNLIVKIHLPQPAAATLSGGTAPAPPSDRGGRLARWLRLGSTTGVRA